MDFFTLLWIFLLLSSLQPALRKRYLDTLRAGAMRNLQEQRNSRVIALIHRQETISFLGLPLVRYIDINDSEELLRAIKHTDPNRPIDLVLHTPGGLVLAAEQVAWALRDHPAKVTVFVPHYAMSGGTLISMAADEIVMDAHAVLGPVDPQIGEQAAASILSVIEAKDPNEVEDKTLMLADISRKAIVQVSDTVFDLLQGRMPEEGARALVQELASGRYTHDFPIRVQKARSLGLNVSTDMPELVYKLMELYPQTSQRRPSVEYIPEPVMPRVPRHADGSDR